MFEVGPVHGAVALQSLEVAIKDAQIGQGKSLRFIDCLFRNWALDTYLRIHNVERYLRNADISAGSS